MGAPSSFFTNGPSGAPSVINTTPSSFWAVTAPKTAFEFNLDGAGDVLATGDAGYFEVPFNCTVLSWTLVADEIGSLVTDVRRCTFAQFNPPTHPAAADSITDTNVPTLSNQIANQSTSLTTWQTLNEGDMLAINVVSASTIKRATLSLKVQRR